MENSRYCVYGMLQTADNVSFQNYCSKKWLLTTIFNTHYTRHAIQKTIDYVSKVKQAFSVFDIFRYDSLYKEVPVHLNRICITVYKLG